MTKQHLKETVSSRESSDYAILPLYIYTHDAKTDFTTEYHWHDELEFIYVEKGDLVININGTNKIAPEGGVYLINSQEIHQITAITPNSLHYAIVFDPKIIRFEWYDPAGQKYITPLIKGKVKYPFHFNDFEEIKQIIVKEMQDAVNAHTQKKAGWQITVKASLLKIIATLIEHETLELIDTSADKDNQKAIFTKTIMTHIHENYAEKITIDDLAKVANLSTQYFCKVFKSIFEKTAIEYINEYRIEKACLLLTQTDDKIIDVAFSVGFDNFSYFIRKFKELKGITPSAYRGNQ